MENSTRKQSPVSLAGCTGVFEECGIPKSIYTKWDFKHIYDFAELIYEKIGVEATEMYIKF